MAEIVNLRSARKARTRAEAARQAERNRHAFGRRKADKLGAEGEKARLEAIVDGAKREPE